VEATDGSFTLASSVAKKFGFPFAVFFFLLLSVCMFVTDKFVCLNRRA